MTQTQQNHTEWKILAAQIIIGVLCGIEIVVHGDGNVLASAITAEGILGGVQLTLYQGGKA